MVENARVPLKSLRSVLLSFLDDDCMPVFENCTPERTAVLDELKYQMYKLFSVCEETKVDSFANFFSRKQFRNEKTRSYFSELWRFANIAFKNEPCIDHDQCVHDRFISRLCDPYLDLQKTSNNSNTSLEALNSTMKMMAHLNSTTHPHQASARLS
ncbi:hypothetical protein BpHYR1_042311 [Brachionus plicatilis]|uniref:Uncharacterized protein n=1 Tax=Brachionus plicatilis TaxID=10195 RepID=A0A3M7TAH4_BRAPC|nr:hypothetical protein BpHYR1_042311 [Brachionus plicatilis]